MRPRQPCEEQGSASPPGLGGDQVGQADAVGLAAGRDRLLVGGQEGVEVAAVPLLQVPHQAGVVGR